MILQIQRGLLEDSLKVSIEKLCRWFEVPRRTVYYKPTKAASKVSEVYVKPIKAMIEENPAFGYRTVAYLLGMNKNTVQRVFQLMNWQVRKRLLTFAPVYKPCLLLLNNLMSVGPLTCAVFGVAKMVGQAWPWLSIATSENYWVGT